MINLDNHPIVKNKVPFIVKRILNKTHMPQNQAQLIQFCQELAKIIIKDTEPINLN